MSILPILINMLNAVPSKITTEVSVNIDKITLKSRGKGKETLTAKTILKKISKLEESVCPILKLTT